MTLLSGAQKLVLARSRRRLKRVSRGAQHEVVEVVVSDAALVEQRGTETAIRFTAFFDTNQRLVRGELFVADDVDMDGDEYLDAVASLRAIFGYNGSLEPGEFDCVVGNILSDERWEELA